MKIFLAAAYDVRNPRWDLFAGIEKNQRRDRVGKHVRVADPADADVILFVDLTLRVTCGDWRLKALHENELVRKYPQKIMVFDESDDPWPQLPGVYVNLPKSIFDASRQRAGAYSGLLNELVSDGTEVEPDLLFSFVGSRSHEARNAIFELNHPRAVIDRNHLNMFTSEPGDEMVERKRQFAQITARSKFVLCPRGIGTSSIRMFECLCAGRVPVIVSDDWVAPVGPRWDDFSLRIRENEIARLPQFLEENEPRFESMSAAARTAYSEWFAPDIWWHRLGELCAELLNAPHEPEFGVHKTLYFLSFYARNAVKEFPKLAIASERLRNAVRNRISSTRKRK